MTKKVQGWNTSNYNYHF